MTINNIMNYQHTHMNSCYDCDNKLKSIGTSVPCTYCELKKTLKCENCPSMTSHARLCNECELKKEISELKIRNTELRDIINIYQNLEDRKRGNQPSNNETLSNLRKALAI